MPHVPSHRSPPRRPPKWTWDGRHGVDTCRAPHSRPRRCAPFCWPVPPPPLSVAWSPSSAAARARPHTASDARAETPPWRLAPAKVRRSRWPILVMAPMRCRPPVRCSRGVIPIQAANSRPFFEVRHVRRISGQRKRRDGPDAGNRHQAPRGFQCLHVRPAPSLQWLDGRVHVIHRREPRLQRETRRLGHRTIVILHPLSQATDVRHALGGRHAVLRQRTADRIHQLRALFKMSHMWDISSGHKWDILNSHQHRMTELADFTPPVMRTAADFQCHGAACLLRQEHEQAAYEAKLADRQEARRSTSRTAGIGATGSRSGESHG